jgi:hypothetical protein
MRAHKYSLDVVRDNKNYFKIIFYLKSGALVCLFIVLSLIIFSPKADASVRDEFVGISHPHDATCRSRTIAGDYGVYGYSYFDPSSVTVSPTGQTIVRMYNYLCNASANTVTGNVVKYRDNVAQLDFGPSGLYLNNGWRHLFMVDPFNSNDTLASGRRIVKSFEVAVNGSAIPANGITRVGIRGYGIIWERTSAGDDIVGETNREVTRYILRVTVAPDDSKVSILRIPTDGLSDADVIDQNVRIQSPYPAPYSYNQLNSSGLSYTFNNVAPGDIRVSASQNIENANFPETGRKQQQLRNRTRICAYNGSNCGSWSSWSGWDDQGRSSFTQKIASTPANQLLDVQIEYRPAIRHGIVAADCDIIRGFIKNRANNSIKYTIEIYRRPVSGGSYEKVREVIADGPSNLNPPSEWDGHVFEVDMSQFNDMYRSEYQLRVKESLQNESGVIGARTIGYCVRPACGGASLSPSGPIESGIIFSVDTDITFNNSYGSDGYNLRYRMIMAIYKDGNRVLPTNTELFVGEQAERSNSPTILSVNQFFNNLSIEEIGEYEVRWRIRWNPNSPNAPVENQERFPASEDFACSRSFSVSDIPYVSVYGNDVIAETINTYYNTEERTQNYANPAPVSGGSSVQFAAMAIRNINGFASAKMRDSDPRAIKGLTFANVGADTYGGNFGGTNRISPYYALIPTGMDPEDSGYILNGLGITPGDSQTIYVDGDAFITGDISYTEENEWTPSNIPQFRLIVRGNIYIGSGVTNLAGLYVAEKRDNNTGGNIITCSNPAGNGPMPINQIYTDCVQQLTINGSFIAHNKVILNRYGNSSLRYVRPDTEFPYTNNNIPCANNIQRGTCAAEVFNFSPEMYLGVPADTKPTSSTTQGKYDSIISLPPVL